MWRWRQKGNSVQIGKLRPNHTRGQEERSQRPEGTYQPWSSGLHILLTVVPLC